MTSVEFWLLMIAIFILILISAFFSSSETALTAASDARMHQLSRKGDKRASLVKKLRSKRDVLISSLLGPLTYYLGKPIGIIVIHNYYIFFISMIFFWAFLMHYYLKCILQLNTTH